MPRVTFIDRTGRKTTVDGEDGQSVMLVARRHGIDGITGDCGGSCACGTCHVYVAAKWRALTGEAGADESDVLDLVDDRRPESRLSCQIRLVPALNGIAVTVSNQHPA